MADKNCSAFELGRACAIIVSAYRNDSEFRDAFVDSIGSALSDTLRDYKPVTDRPLAIYIADRVIGIDYEKG